MTDIIAKTMPLAALQAGVWDGEYVHFDDRHREIDRHASRLICRLHDGPDGEARLEQSNIYSWPDGSREIRYFDGVFREDRIWIQNDLIDGWTAQIQLDPTERSLMVAWVRVNEPGYRFYELITMSEDGKRKNRTWHWYRNGILVQRTLINELRTSRDWQSFDKPEYYAFIPRTPPPA
jgi:hypothetical protein